MRLSGTLCMQIFTPQFDSFVKLKMVAFLCLIYEKSWLTWHSGYFLVFHHSVDFSYCLSLLMALFKDASRQSTGKTLFLSITMYRSHNNIKIKLPTCLILIAYFVFCSLILPDNINHKCQQCLQMTSWLLTKGLHLRLLNSKVKENVTFGIIISIFLPWHFSPASV